MGNLAIKQKLYRAKRRAKAILTQSDYTVFFLDDHTFSLEAIRERELRIIRICLGEPTRAEVEGVKRFPFPDYYSKEIWTKKHNSRNFIVKTLKP